MVLFASACTGGGGGGSGDAPLRIVSCSLGCSSNTSPAQSFQCGITDVYVNQELRVGFNQPLFQNSVNPSTFRLIETLDAQGNPSGRAAPGIWRLDTKDPSILIYTPQITFNSSGQPFFGMNPGATYELHIPGADIDPVGPYVMSESGEENRSRLLCTLLASRGVFDVNAGPPQVEEVTVEDATTRTQNPARGRVNVYRDTNVVIKFDDVMDPDTLLDIVTGQSGTISVLVDPDGDLSNPADQLPVPGTFSHTVNVTPTFPSPISPLEGASTTILFVPENGFPSSGSNQASPRRILLRFSDAITDLAGNRLVDPGIISFVIEQVPFTEITVDETFLNTSFSDTPRNGATWGGGELAKGSGGGLGRLGDLRIPQGQTVTLRTDGEDFSGSLLSDPTVFHLENVLGTQNLANYTVDDGIFEFARLVVEPGSTLRLEGTNPGRLYVRGECIVQGTIDLDGGDAPVHDPDLYLGGLAGLPGAAGGAGGQGGARPDGEMFAGPLNDPTLDNPFNPGPVMPSVPGQYDEIDGEPGVGILFPDTLTGTPVAEGDGGFAWPQPGIAPAPDDTWHFPLDQFDVVGTFPYSPFALCSVNAPGGVGSGAAHALDGFPGDTRFIPSVTNPPRVPDAQPGLAAELMLTPQVRTLDPFLGLLRGGGGGGGAGGHILGTKVNGTLLFDCFLPIGGMGVQRRVIEYAPASGGGGGSGGGALQVQAGGRLILNGVITAAGGDGGSSTANEFAQPGGGGSGGSVLLQSPALSIRPIPDRVVVRGGQGGTGAVGSLGGDGSPGFLRLESYVPTPDISVEGLKVGPTDAELKLKYIGAAAIEDVLSTAEWIPSDVNRPDSQSGVQSCWFSDRDFFEPGATSSLANFFELIFSEDNGTDLGWDMTVRITGFGSQSFRGENDITGPGGMSLEERYTKLIGTAPILVRFQGAHTTGSLAQSCGVTIAGPNSEIVAGSLTRWVDHPSQLSDFHGNPSLTPNIFRFAILWDRAAMLYDEIEAVEEITINLTPN